MSAPLQNAKRLPIIVQRKKLFEYSVGKLIWFFHSPLSHAMLCLVMMDFDWLVAAACGGTIGTEAYMQRGNNGLAYFNPKPQCWKTPNLYTVGGDEHGKWGATAAAASTFSTVTVTLNTI